MSSFSGIALTFVLPKIASKTTTARVHVDLSPIADSWMLPVFRVDGGE